MIRGAVLDYVHRREDAAIEGAANRRSVLIDRAALLPQVGARPIRALSEHQFAITVALR
jgi:hypothetical protein